MRRVRPIRRVGLRGLGDLSDVAASIAVYASNAGFSGPDMATAVAIALAESSGNPNSYNPETAAKGGTPIGKGSYGLWQIYLRDHPEFAGWNLYDPQTNANAAFSIYQRKGGFTDWSTFTQGTYAKYLSLVPPIPGAPPLTIDASTGQPVDDSTPTPAADFSNAGMFPPASTASTPGALLGLAAAALGALILNEVLS